MASWDGYWYLSESSIQTLLGDRLPVILNAFKQVKAQLAPSTCSLSRVDIESFIQTHMASMVVALQADGLINQSSGGRRCVYLVYRGRWRRCHQNRATTDCCTSRPSAMLMVRDDDDGEQSSFIWKPGTLTTVDQGVEMVFS